MFYGNGEKSEWINVCFWETATYPSPNLTLTLTSRFNLGKLLGLGRGRWAVSQKYTLIQRSTQWYCEHRIAAHKITTLAVRFFARMRDLTLYEEIVLLKLDHCFYSLVHQNF